MEMTEALKLNKTKNWELKIDFQVLQSTWFFKETAKIYWYNLFNLYVHVCYDSHEILKLYFLVSLFLQKR